MTRQLWSSGTVIVRACAAFECAVCEAATECIVGRDAFEVALKPEHTQGSHEHTEADGRVAVLEVPHRHPGDADPLCHLAE